MTDQNERCPPSSLEPAESAFAALAVLLDYLFLQVRLRDGVPQPPLFDRADFLTFVQHFQTAPAGEWSAQERQGHAWLEQHMQQLADQ